MAKGLVLYQMVALFDYDTKLLCKYAETKKDSNGVEYKAPEAWCERTGRKWNRFIENHRESYQCILPLFENPEYSDEIRKLRNYVEHSKYYIKHDKSVMELYSEYYTKFFGYSNKFRRSVLFSLEVIFGRYAIEPVIVFDDASNVVLVDEEYARKHRMKKYTRCRENTYKCMDENVEVKLKLGARSDTFMKGMFALFNRSK